MALGSDSARPRRSRPFANGLGRLRSVQRLDGSATHQVVATLAPWAPTARGGTGHVDPGGLPRRNGTRRVRESRGGSESPLERMLGNPGYVRWVSGTHSCRSSGECLDEGGAAYARFETSTPSERTAVWLLTGLSVEPGYASRNQPAATQPSIRATIHLYSSGACSRTGSLISST